MLPCLLLLIPATSALSAHCFGPLEIDLPVRYLHIQPVVDGINATTSLGDIHVTLEHDQCRLYHEVIDRMDGQYIFRLQLLSSCPSFTVSFKLHGKHLCSKEVRKDSGSLLPESCRCPIDLDFWLHTAQCTTPDQILSDLSRWESIDFQDVIDKVHEKWGSERMRYSSALCHYQIIDNQVYRRCYGEHVGFHQYADAILTSLTRKIRLPNTEFIMNLGDYPLERDLLEPVPIFSWCGSTNTADIVAPTYSLTESILSSPHTFMQIHKIRRPPKDHVPWERKHNKLVFRGRDSNQERLSVAAVSTAHPSLIDAGVTSYFFHDEHQHSPATDRMPFQDFFKYRYILSIDGTVAAYRLPFLLDGDSVIFKTPSAYYEHFYNLLIPGLHYIPVAATQKELLEKVEWARRQDFNKTLQAQRQLVLDHLQPINIYCYWATLIKEYSSLLSSPPCAPDEDMVLVEDPPVSPSFCDCPIHDEL